LNRNLVAALPGQRSVRVRRADLLAHQVLPDDERRHVEPWCASSIFHGG
jgi:hypothetical protein